MNAPNFGSPPPSPFGPPPGQSFGGPPGDSFGGPPRSNGLATASAVCGGIATFSLFVCCPVLGLVGLNIVAMGLSVTLGFVAMILGFMGMKSAGPSGTGRGAAIAGLIMGLINVLFGLVFVVMIVVLGAAYVASMANM